MATIKLRLDKNRLASLSKRLDDLSRRAQNLGPFFDDASAYMVNVVQNRILRTKKAPDGSRWPKLSELTSDLKGHDTVLYQTGELARSVKADQATKNSISIKASADYAGYMHRGVKRTGGRWPGKEIPARPFMGFSDTNIKVISKMLKDHVAGRGSGSQGYGEAE